MGNNKRIAKNTLFLYFRMLLTMGVSLYTSRVVLNVLGVEDFGIYNVVAGVVAMFTFLNGSLSSASQRFITFELGRNDFQSLKEVFSTTVTIHNLIALTIFIFAETIGYWFLNNKMNIVADRMEAANWVFQCSVLAFMIDVISVPYNAAIIAHEHMKTFAYVGIVEVVLKLIVVLLLPVLFFDKLKLYALLILVVTIIIRIIYGIYCKRSFKECSCSFKWNKLQFKSILSFAGWNFIGATSHVLMTQGVNVLLNIFYGVVVNAAQGVAVQVQNAVVGFVNSFMTALNPQITKSYAQNDREYLYKLVNNGAKYSYCLMLFFAIPILLETKMVLQVWLSNIPLYTIVFVQMVIVNSLIQVLSNTMIIAQLATGKIRTYQIVVGGVLMLNFPLSYFALKFGYLPQSTFIISIVISLISLYIRMLFLNKMISLSIMGFVKDVIIKVMIVTVLSFILPMLFRFIIPEGFIRILFVILSAGLSVCVVAYLFVLSKVEKEFVIRKINNSLFKREYGGN